MYISIESDLRRSPDPCIQDVDEDRMKLYGQSRGHVLPCCHVAGRFESEVLLPLPLLVHGVKDGLPLGVVTSPQVVYLLLHLRVQTSHPGKEQMGVSWGEEHIIMTRALELLTVNGVL